MRIIPVWSGGGVWYFVLDGISYDPIQLWHRNSDSMAIIAWTQNSESILYALVLIATCTQCIKDKLLVNVTWLLMLASNISHPWQYQSSPVPSTSRALCIHNRWYCCCCSRFFPLSFTDCRIVDCKQALLLRLISVVTLKCIDRRPPTHV